MTGAEVEVIAEIQMKTKAGVMEDSVMKMVAGFKDSKVDTVQGAEWNLWDDLVYYRDCIYVLEDKDLQRRIVEQHHDMKVAGHLGRWKTHELVATNVLLYWYLLLDLRPLPPHQIIMTNSNR